MKLFDGIDQINEYLSEAIRNDNVELELIFGSRVGDNPLDKKIFMKLLENCKTQYRMIKESTDLDIRQEYKNNPSNVRATIHGLDNIKKYCKNEKLDEIENIEYVQKQSYNDSNGNPFRPLRDEDFNVRMNLKKEVKLHDRHNYVMTFIRDFGSKKKHYRYKKRFSFETIDKLFRIDLSVIKATQFKRGSYDFAKTFKEANILKNKEIYELEIEYIGWDKSYGQTGVKNIDNLYKIIEQDLVLTQPGMASIGNEYDPLNLGIELGDSSDFETYDFNYDFDSPRYTEEVLVNFRSGKTVRYSESDYEVLIGKFVKITDLYFEDFEVDKKIHKALVEYYKRGVNIGIVTDVFEELNDKGEYNDMILEISIYPGIAGVTKLSVPLYYIYGGNFTVDASAGKIYQGTILNQLKMPDGTVKMVSQLNQGSPELSISSGGGKSSDEKKVSKAKIVKGLLEILEDHVVFISKIIYDTENLMSYKEKREIIDKYKSLTGQRAKYFTFMGPQPVTLTLDDIKINSGKSIIVDYAVTEKADGERYQMFVTNNHGYLINSKMNVIDMNMFLYEIKGDWILDGEYITKDRYNEPMNLFMVFDVYWGYSELLSIAKDKQIHDYQFMSTVPGQTSRLALMKEFFSKIKNEGSLYYLSKQERPIELGMKEYLFGYVTDDYEEEYILPDKKQSKDIFKVSKKILKKDKDNQFPYRIDGLIYLPVKLSVKGSVKGIKKQSISGTWKYNYKWKPPEENSIDFEVKVKKEVHKSKIKDLVIPFPKKISDGSTIIEEYKQVELIVGYKDIEDDNINFCMEILDRTVEKNKNIQLFNVNAEEDERYNTTNILIRDDKMFCLNGDEIKNGDIVEMRFIPEAENGKYWEPMRVRSDKTKPQFFTIANKVWDTIQNPVEESIIVGDYKVKKGDDPYKAEVGKYYVDEENDSLYESNKLRKLHNYIKSKLIGGVCSLDKKPINILDLSCGRGGDISKYINKDTKVNFMLGLDISSNVHEACKRFYKDDNGVQAAFLRADTSKNIKNGECAIIEGNTLDDRKHCETMINIIYNNGKDVPTEYKKIRSKYSNKATKGFDVISSQFSIHYYFENEKTFMGFLENVKDNIKKGGYFIGTCYDGGKIYDHFKEINEMYYNKDSTESTESDSDSESESEPEPNEYKELKYIDTNGNKVFSIEKEYDIDAFEYNPDDTSNIFGNKINVYMDSIGQTIPEYLVNMDYLRDIMEQHGFELVIPDKVNTKYSNLFRKDYFENNYGQFANVIDNLSEINSSDKQFRDYYSEALDMRRIRQNKIYDKKSNKNIVYESVNNNPLIRLSSFNNYFIFKKL